MPSLRRIILAVALGFAASSAAQAGPITYTASRAVGTGNANISITTDGTIGTIATSNVIDWTIAMTDGSDSFTLLGPLSGSNSVLLVSGSAFTATASDLLFNFSAGGGQFALFQSPNIGAGQLFYSFQTSGSYSSTPGEAIDPRTNFSFTATNRTGSFVVASAAPGTAVPEPSTVASLGLAGLIGLFARRRRRMLAMG